MSILGANRQEPTINAMRATIQGRIQTIDKYELPQQVDPRHVRDSIMEKDLQLRKTGTRIISRMTKSPMGIIFSGDIEQAEQALATIVQNLASA
jgi:hypothetical protein